MNPKDPSHYAPLTYLWVMVIALWGGLTHYIHRRQTGQLIRGFWTELFFDLCYSSFSGVITFYLCQAANMDMLLTAALVGIAGHMGSRLIFGLEELFSGWFRKHLNLTLHGDTPDNDFGVTEEEDTDAKG